MFEAKIAAAGATASSSRQSAVLTSTSSNTASTTRSASATCDDVVGRARSGRASRRGRSRRAGPWRPPGRGWRRSGRDPPRRGRAPARTGRPTSRSRRGPGRCRGPSARHPPRRPVRSMRHGVEGTRPAVADATDAGRDGLTSDRPRRAAGPRRCTDRGDGRRPRRGGLASCPRRRAAEPRAHAVTDDRPDLASARARRAAADVVRRPVGPMPIQRGEQLRHARPGRRGRDQDLRPLRTRAGVGHRRRSRARRRRDEHRPQLSRGPLGARACRPCSRRRCRRPRAARP